jgi:threonine dehydratase
LVTPVGGGGLASGLVVGLREAGARAEVWGAEPLLANDAARSLRSGRVESNTVEPATIADGARTSSLGRHNWPILRHGLAGIVEVPEAEIRAAVPLSSLANLKAERRELPSAALLAPGASAAGRSPAWSRAATSIQRSTPASSHAG